MPCPLARLASVSAACLIAAACAFIAAPSNAEAACAGIPSLCGMTCSPDAFGTPVYCSDGQCSCAPGYDTETTPGGLVCQPIQPEVIGTESDEYSCPGICASDADHRISPAVPWAYVGSIYNAFDLVPVHGIAPGGEAFMPVWGYQATYCGDHGREVTDSTDGHTYRTWEGTAGTRCAPDPFPFCYGIQSADEGDWDYNNCHSAEGCGNVCGDVIPIVTPMGTMYDLRCKYLKPPDSAPPGTKDACNYCSACVSDFTSAWPYIDNSITCELGTIFGIDANTTDPARIDFPNNVIVYRAPTRFEEFSDFWDNPIDDDYTWDMESPGHELFDAEAPEFAYHTGCADETHGRIHIEFSSDETIDRFTGDDWGAANQWWRGLRHAADSSDSPAPPRCYVKSSVNTGPNGLTCPTDEDVDATCRWHDPLAVVVGVPSLDCADDPYHGTDEIHPVLAMAIRIQEDPGKPEQWAFFYRQNGGTGPCGDNHYSRCLSMFKLPLGLPVVPPDSVLKGADVHVDWHPWADKFIGDPSPDITLTSSFDLTNGTVLTIHLPHKEDGVVGLVTITPDLDTTPPQLTCPADITQTVDLGRCTAAVTINPTVSDDCTVSTVCSPPSGSAFPIGTTPDTCTATDQAQHSVSCSFNVTVTAGNKCPQAQGYWKNHASLWPVSSLTLGSVTYDKSHLLSILKSSTTSDASVILAREEIAALLNLANGSSPTPVCGTIADADGALGASIVPAKVAVKTDLGQRMVGDAGTLDDYNLGRLTPGCTP